MLKMGCITSPNDKLDWGLSSYVPQSHIGPSIYFHKQSFIGTHNHTHLCMYCHLFTWLLHIVTAKQHGCNRDHMDSKATNIYYLDLYRRKFASPKVNRSKYIHERLFRLDASYISYRKNYLFP